MDAHCTHTDIKKIQNYKVEREVKNSRLGEVYSGEVGPHLTAVNSQTKKKKNKKKEEEGEKKMKKKRKKRCRTETRSICSKSLSWLYRYVAKYKETFDVASTVHRR
jgi:hypothetical protein